ncbi:sigma D regulator [Shewanella sp. NIFS-20-20]|uniref:sigma D regulator n=1 Tax=Shewanella sp. NIFS-20-20 TaxID=2853806 RepID=UPI001C442C7C|nr:sigma D regulator [Shewanella sp. NIFS-20-20]MBV7316479.1 sigma D regulator [Shewanella sp. NIFS-20-20]
MLTKLEKAEKEWGGANKLIDQWLEHRRNLLISYCKLAGCAPYPSKSCLPNLSQVNQFCDLIVDYVSEGHFDVYNHMVTACEQHGQHSRELVSKLLPEIHQTTDDILDFSDKYADAEEETVLYDLDQDLANLIHALETRFGFEDQLLEILYLYVSVAPAESSEENSATIN